MNNTIQKFMTFHPSDFPGKKLEYIASSFPRASSQPRNWTQVSVGRFFTTEPTGKPLWYQLLLFTHWVTSDTLWSHGLQDVRLPCPSLFPRVGSKSCPLSWWCHPTISSVAPFSYLESFPASGSFPTGRLFTSGGQSTGASASPLVLPMNIQGWFPLGSD